MRLSLRLLLAAAAIVTLSLVISGALSWVLVRQLEINNARDELALQVISEHAVVQRQECSNPGTGCLPRALTPGSEYEARLRTDAEALPGDRLLLITRSGVVVFDSQNPDNSSQIRLGRSRVVNQQPVSEGDVILDGQSYIASGAGLTPAHNPLGAAFVVIARPTAAVTARASSDLAPLLLLAGAISLTIALGLALLATRALTRPLSELAAAAEDVAAGNYSRRVAISGGDEIGVLGSAFNRMAEAVERARKLQRDFLANVSHELKTPLTSLIGFSQALVDGSLRTEGERGRAAVILHEEAERVLRMAQELLDLARVESGQISLQLQPVDLGAQLVQELDLVRKRADERGLKLALRTVPTLPPVTADPERLHQVLDNLLDNAVKYAPAGSTVAVTTGAGPEGVTTIVSNPVGEHRPDTQRMFDRFYRADPSRSSGAGGVGLGLAISRELVSAHGGRLWADIEGDELRVHLLMPGPSLSSPPSGEEALNPRSAAPPGRRGSPAGASPRP